MKVEERFAYDSFRPGQRELANQVHDSCLKGDVLVAEAHSGFGKTAAVLSGAISAAEETHSRIVYACRTKRQIARVVNELSLIQKKHRTVSGSSMLSKFDYCLLRRRTPSVTQDSFGWYCGFNVSNNLCSYYLNVTLSGDFEEAVKDYIESTPSHRELLRKGESIHICPYEIARLALTESLVVVVPYHYVFDERYSSQVFSKSSTEKANTILVVDEAHNLRDFLKGMNSSILSIDQITGAEREATALQMEDAAMSLRVFREEMGRLLSSPGWLIDRESAIGRLRSTLGNPWLQNLAFELTSCREAAWWSIIHEKRTPSLVLRVGDFLSRLSSDDGSVVVKWERNVGILRPNPVAGLSETLDSFRSAVLLSATLNPSDVFIRSLGLERVRTYSSSSDPMVTVRTLVDNGVTTRYKERTPRMFARIAERILAVISSSEDGVGVFVPSYSVLEPLVELVSRRVEGRQVSTESRGLSNEDAEEIFETFRSNRGSILFGVQGGRFSEGEDFRGDMMGTVIVVGLSVPPPSPILFAEYVALRKGGEPNAYLMISRLPALRKAFQAAGRHVRSPGKRGLVVLMDERFDSEEVRQLMPAWMASDLVTGNLEPELLSRITGDFWECRRLQLSPS